MNKIPALHQQVLDQAKSKALGKYVWDCGIGPQMRLLIQRCDGAYTLNLLITGVYTLLTFLAKMKVYANEGKIS